MPERVYRVVHEHKTRIIEKQVIVFSDILHFGNFINRTSVKDVEAFLLFNESIHTAICSEFRGTVRAIVGDEYFFTFQDEVLLNVKNRKYVILAEQPAVPPSSRVYGKGIKCF